jgi:hypothetical protein
VKLKYIVTWQLKVGAVEQDQAAGTRQRRGKHVSAVTNQHATVDEVLEVVFYMWSVPRPYITRTSK